MAFWAKAGHLSSFHGIMVLICTLLIPLMVTGFPNPSQEQAYQVKSVQNVDSNADSSGGIWDIAFALMPQVESLVKNVTEQASSSSLKEVERFQDIISLFIPFMRKTLEFQAEDEGRTVNPEELETLDAVEFALYYISDLASSNLASSGSSSGGSADVWDFIPDYTDLLQNIPDVNIPPIFIEEADIPDVTIPEINIPGGPDIPEKKISFQSIPAVDIPGKTIPVTSAPVTVRPSRRRTKPTDRSATTGKLSTGTSTSDTASTMRIEKPQTVIKQTTRAPTTAVTEPRVPVKSSSRVAPSSVLREKLFAPESGLHEGKEVRKQKQPFRHVPQRAEGEDSPTLFHSLPGGGYFYSVTQS
ncbi:uncharacterized protein [Palaemon carinicauda]|uniref:uncharacterized protein n=1 Tax=Palaemon carinicauda TaxID=392227 RepID=UPI0035B69D22